MVVVNYLFSKDRSLEDSLRNVAKGLHLNVYGEGDVIYFGDRGDNPISNVRKNAEKILSDVTGIDVSTKLEKLAIVEGMAYDTYQTIKNVFHKNKDEHSENSSSFDAINYGNDMFEKNDELLEAKDDNRAANEENSSQIYNDDSAKEIDTVSKDKVEPENNIEADMIVDIKSEKTEIEEWTSENETQNISAVNYENILKIDEEEIDKHFEEIEKNTSEILKRVEQKAREIKNSVENKCSETSEVVGKLKKFTDKIMTFKKK
jgi:hypothetical protein